jgi:hypothetical protein
MDVKARTQFAGWLARNYPDLFEAMAAHALNENNLSGWTDIFSSIGTGVAKVLDAGSTLVTKVGDFIGTDNGQKTLAQLTGLYAQTQANKDAVKVQLAQAAANKPPAPITTTTQPTTGTTVPVYAPPGQPATPLTPQVAQNLIASSGASASIMSGNVLTIALVVGAALLGALLPKLAGRGRS